jgi:hypothetical protein
VGRIITINDSNFHLYVQDQHVDGERKARGLMPRNFRSHPPGYLGAMAKKWDQPLIPDGEIDDRIQMQEKMQSSLQHLRLKGGPNGGPIPSRDQNGVGYSHDEATEVLTERGWTRWADWNHVDMLGTINPVDHALEFQAATEWHASEYKGETYHSTNRRVDFGVTNYHRMYVRKFDQARRVLSDTYSFQLARDLGWYVGLLHAPARWRGTELTRLRVPGGAECSGNDFIALVALILSDGFVCDSESERSLVSFCCFDERYQGVADLAARVGFREQPSRKGVWNRRDPALAAWVRENCYVGGLLGAANKCVPAILKWTSAPQIRHFLKWFADKDRTRDHYYSASKRLIDDLQELFLRVGKRGSIARRDPRTSIRGDGTPIHSKESWELHVGETDQLCLDRKKHVETDGYRGLVYCATVPNGILVTRRNGSVLLSGNCWCHSGVSAQLLVRAAMGESYLDLSPFSIGCPIKNYRDEGGWGAEGVEFQGTKGCATSEFWPQRSMSKSNDNPKTWENAAKHKYVQWMDCSDDARERKLQVMTALLLNWPVIADFNWWSHSVCLARLMSRDKTRLWNSWGDSWSDQGFGDLDGRKAWPDAALVAIVTAPALV